MPTSCCGSWTVHWHHSSGPSSRMRGTGDRTPCPGSGKTMRSQSARACFSNPGVHFAGTPAMSVDRIRREAGLAGHVAMMVEAQPPAAGTALDRLGSVRAALAADPEWKWALEPEALPAWRHRRRPTRDGPGQPAGRPSSRAAVCPNLPLAARYPGAGRVCHLLGHARLRGAWNSARRRAGFGDGLGRGAGDRWAALRPAAAAGGGGSAGRPSARAPCGRRDHGARELRRPEPSGRALGHEARHRLRRFTLTARLLVRWRSLSARYYPARLPRHPRDDPFRALGDGARTRDLLFLSNYGGSWESYLEDFITKAHTGLTGIWSNTVGFPRTTNLFQDGATDGERFKRWARRQQVPTGFWYSAYPDLTTANIRTNAAIRQGLAAAMTEDEAQGMAVAVRLAAAPGERRSNRARSRARVRAAWVSCARRGRPVRARRRRAGGQGLAAGHAAERRLRRRPVAAAGDHPRAGRLGACAGWGCPRRASRPSLAPSSTAWRRRGDLRALGDVGANAPKHWWWGGMPMTQTAGRRGPCPLRPHHGGSRPAQARRWRRA